MRHGSYSVNGHISLKGTFLVRCKILSAQLKVSRQRLGIEVVFYERSKIIVHFLCSYIAC